jgi:plastocyanin
MTDLCNDLHFDFDSLIGWQNTENICDYVEDTVGSEMDVDSIESLYDAIWADIDAGNYDEPSNTLPMTQTISLAQGSGVPGCETNNACYLPYSVTVGIGATVTWSNDDTAAHTVTSGSAANGATGEFDSAFIMAGTTWSHTFDYGGVYDYYCMVHPWMQGTVYVGPTY